MLHAFMTFAALLLLTTVTGLAQAPGRWMTNTFAPLPHPEEEFTAVVSNNRLYLLGGNRGGRKEWPRHVLEYDLASDRWTTKKPVPFPGDHMAAAALGGKIYVFGGQAEGGVNKPLNTAWEYDAAADAWRPLAPMPTARTAAGAVEVGGRIYVVGGNTVGGVTIGLMEMYDPTTNRWEGRPTMPTPRNHPAIGAVGGRIYVIGGRLAAPNIGGFVASNTDVVEEYDPATNAWRALNKMPTPRSGHGFTTHQGRIYVAGGEMRDAHMDAIFRDVEVFDPATNDWYRLPPMPTARHGVNLAGYGNRLHAIGGHIAFAATGESELHTPAHEVFEFTTR
ncbi:MAG: galactose oxidase [Acidobacteria bacterium]|nr:galactose oxidase [Acidobacteriota bacterium]